jgi:diguanylate cyclase (GGDEF)-like protein
MAVPTALCMVGLAVSLWLYWSHSAWYVNESYFQEDGKVRLLSGAILIIVTTTASLTSFVLQQESERSALAERLNSSVRARGPWLQLVVREMRPRVERTALLAVLSSAERQSLQSGAALPAPSPELRTLAQDFAAQGWHRVQVQSASGTAAMALLGSARSQPTFRAPLDATGAVELLWDGALLLRFTQPLLGEAGGKGLRLVMERDATELASVVFSLAGLGQTGEITACVMQDGMLLCLPSRWQPQPFRVQPRPAGSPPLAMQLAVANQRGVREGLDYRQNNVIAAYGQLAPGLGFVIKQDAVEIFAPIRRALGIGVLMTLVVVLGGTAVMAWQLGPLVARMRRAEVLASETAQKMQTLAQYDVLTSLPNRALFMDRLASACLRAARSGEAIAVVFIDVDGFKGINDSLGHAAGDAMLVQTGQRLAGAVRKSDTVARLGGDEFTILLEGMSQAEHDVQAIMDSITRAMHPPLDLLGQQRSVTLSIGVALHPGGSHPVDAGELLTHADQAMYDAKRSGKNTHRLVVLAPPAAEMA